MNRRAPGGTTCKYNMNKQIEPTKSLNKVKVVYNYSVGACQHNVRVGMCLPKCMKFALFADNRILITCIINLIVYHKYTKINNIIHLLPHLNILQLKLDYLYNIGPLRTVS